MVLHARKKPVAKKSRRSAPPQPAAAASQVLAQAEHAHATGELAEAERQLQLLTAMSAGDAKIRARAAKLKSQVSRALAAACERQAAHAEQQQSWPLAAQSWLRVAELRPKDSVPLQRAALAQLQAGTDPREVLELAQRATALAETDPEAQRTLARVYDAAGMQEQARHARDAAERAGKPAARNASGSAAKGASERGLFKRLSREAPN